MSESNRPLNRLLEQPSSPLERALLRAGTDVRASESTRARVFESLGVERTLGGSSRRRVLVFRRSSFLLAAMVISAVAVAIPIVQFVGSKTAVNPSESEALAPPSSESTVERAGQVVAPTEAAVEPAAVPAETPAVKSSRVTDEPSSGRSGAALSGRNALAAELAALDAVRAKLNSGEPKAAQALLDAYQRDFPKARLALEAEVLRIDALDRAGQTDAARKRAATFVQNHPKGVLTGRVRRYLEK